MTATYDACVFCGVQANATPEGKLSKEHAYPDWIRRRLDPKGDVAWFIGGRPIPERTLLEIEIEAVCTACNTGWLSTELEAKVARWIGPSLGNQNRALVLDQNQRTVVGAWAVKTTLMLEVALAEQRGEGFAPASHFRWLYEHKIPPRGCTVCMFSVNIGSGYSRAMLTWAQANVVVPGAPAAPRGYLATFTAGFVGFQVLGFDVAEDNDAHALWRDQPAALPNGVNLILRQLWPAPRRPAFRWPWSAIPADEKQLAILAAWPAHVLGVPFDNRGEGTRSR